MRDWRFAVGFGRDHRCPAAPRNRAADMVAVIAAIGQKHAGRRQVIIDQRIKSLEVGYFAAGHFRSDRQAESVGNEVDFGRKATF